MSFDLRKEDEGWFLRLRIRGQKTNENMRQIWKNITELSLRPTRKPILVEDHMEGSVSPGEFFTLEAMVTKWGLPHTQKVAVADLRTVKEYEDDHFGGTVAYNLGWNNIRVFNTVEEAEAWLGQGMTDIHGRGEMNLMEGSREQDPLDG